MMIFCPKSRPLQTRTYVQIMQNFQVAVLWEISTGLFTWDGGSETAQMDVQIRMVAARHLKDPLVG